MTRGAAPFAALALALTAARSDPLAGRVAGPPSDCIDVSRVNGPDIVDRRTILYRQSGRRTWLARPVGDCPALRPLTTLIVDVYGGRLCRNDRFRVLEPNAIIASGICRFDRFVPYDKVGR